MYKKVILLFTLLCSSLIWQNTIASPVVKDQNTLKSNSGNILSHPNDSLRGFDEASVTARLSAAGVHGSEYTNYMAQVKRRFIIEKYGLKKTVEKHPEQASVKNGNANSTNASPCLNEGFELTAPGTYTSANAVTGWSVSSRQVNSCPANTSWVPGSPEFSIVSTPLLNFPQLGNIPGSPLGGSHVALLNDFTQNQNSTRLSQTLSVSSSNNKFHFAFAGVLENGNHNCCEQSQFQVEIRDCSGALLSCSGINFAPASSLCTGAFGTYALLNGFASTNWRTETIDLTPYEGSCVSINLIASDCIFGGHYASILVDAVCGDDLTVIHPNPYGSIHGSVNYCFGASQAQINAPLHYSSYQWYNATVLPPVTIPQATTSTLLINNPPASLIPPVIYSVSMTSSMGCLFSGTFVLAYSQVSINAVGSAPACLNGASGTATVYAMGSGTGYNYTWLNSTNSVVGTSSIVANLPGGVYTVSVSANGSPGCGSETTSITVGANPSGFSSVLKPYCSSEAYFSIPGGTNYQWYDNLIPVPPPLGNAPSYTNTAPCNGCQFQVSYISYQGCRDSVEYTLAQAAPMLSVSVTPSVCPADHGTATLTISQGFLTGSYCYVFSTGSLSPPYSASLVPVSGDSFIAPGLPANTYSSNVFDGSCTYSSSFSIGYLIPPFDFTLSSTSQTLCNLNTANAGISFSSSPAPSEYSYSWSPNLFIGGNSSSQNVIISPTLSAGTNTTLTYSVIVTPSVVNCPLTKTLSVFAANVSPPLISAIPVLCDNSAPYTISVTPGGGVFTNNGTNTAVNSTGVISPSSALTGTNTFTYSVLVTNCLSSASGSFYVTASPLLQGVFSTTICPGETITLGVSGADTYTWNTTATGASVTVSPLAPIAYTVTGTSLSNSCSASQQIVVNVTDCTSLQEFSAGKNLRIYPNPANGRFFIETSENITISLVDDLGKLILERTLQNGRQALDLSEYANGIYLLKVLFKDKTETIKLVKIN